MPPGCRHDGGGARPFQAAAGQAQGTDSRAPCLSPVQTCTATRWWLPLLPQEFAKNLKREFAKLQAVLQAYAIISTRVMRSHRRDGGLFLEDPSITTRSIALCPQVRMVASNQPSSGKAPRSTILSSPGAGSLRSSLVTVLGTAVVDGLESLAFEFEAPGCCTSVRVSGWVDRRVWLASCASLRGCVLVPNLRIPALNLQGH